MKIKSILPWLGSKRALAPTIVEELGPHSYYFEPCTGSMAVLLAKKPSSNETVCDLHGALINLAAIIKDDIASEELFERLQRTLYSDTIYAESKQWLAEWEDKMPSNPAKCGDWAYHYFIASWMGRNGVAGTARCNYQIATRWTAKGGSGPLRFRNAVASIPEWCDRLRNVHILRRDLFEVLAKVEDAPGLAIYADPPYLLDTRSQANGKTNKYLHEFTVEQHQQLAELLRSFRHARVVVSYYASPLLAELYPDWTQLDCSRHKHLHVQNKRGMGRIEAPEVLLINGPSLVAAKPQLLFGS